jgi:hypothetical protein
MTELEIFKREIEQALSPGLKKRMEQLGLQLTLSSSNHAGYQPVVIADELVEDEFLGDMASYRSDVTGVDNTIFLSSRANSRHAPRMKIAIDPPDSLGPGSKTASIALHDGSVVAGEHVPAALLRQVQQFIELNRDALLDYWNETIDTRQLDRRLKSIA